VKPNAESEENDDPFGDGELNEHPLYARSEACNVRIALRRTMVSKELLEPVPRYNLRSIRNGLWLLFTNTATIVPFCPDIETDSHF